MSNHRLEPKLERFGQETELSSSTVELSLRANCQGVLNGSAGNTCLEDTVLAQSSYYSMQMALR